MDNQHAPSALHRDEAVGCRLRRACGCLRRATHLHATTILRSAATAVLRPAIRTGSARPLLSVAEHLPHLLRLLGRHLLGRALRLVRLVLWHAADGPSHAIVGVLRRAIARSPHAWRLLLRRRLLLLRRLTLRLAPATRGAEGCSAARSCSAAASATDGRAGGFDVAIKPRSRIDAIDVTQIKHTQAA